MKAPVSWIREYVDLPGEVTAAALAHELTALGLKLESLEGADIEALRERAKGQSPGLGEAEPVLDYLLGGEGG